MAEQEWKEASWARTLTALFLPSPFRQIGVPLFIGLVAALISDFGADVPGDFYAATAQVAPVIALAAMVELAIALRPEVGAYQRMPPGDQMDTRWAILSLVHVQLGLFVVTEATALYALASKSSNTFLVVTVAAGLATQAWWLGWAARERYGLEPPDDEKEKPLTGARSSAIDTAIRGGIPSCADRKTALQGAPTPQEGLTTTEGMLRGGWAGP